MRRPMPRVRRIARIKRDADITSAIRPTRRAGRSVSDLCRQHHHGASERHGHHVMGNDDERRARLRRRSISLARVREGDYRHTLI